MNDEILEKWKEKTKGLFHLVEWTRFWNYITNLQQENKKISIQHLETVNKLIEVESRIEKAVEYIREQPKRELSVDCYFKFEDLVEFDELLNILEGKSDE